MGPVTQQILWAAAIIAATGVIGKGVWWLWKRVLQPLELFVNDWRGEPERPGISPGRPGIPERLSAIERQLCTLATREELAALRERVDAVEQQLKPNGGTTFRDAVDRAMERPRIESGGVGFAAELATGG